MTGVARPDRTHPRLNALDALLAETLGAMRAAAAAAAAAACSSGATSAAGAVVGRRPTEGSPQGPEEFLLAAPEAKAGLPAHAEGSPPEGVAYGLAPAAAS